MEKELPMMVIIISLFIVSGIFKSQQDTIMFNPEHAWSQSYWWLNKDYQFGFLLKVPFSFLMNGWHFCDTVRTFSLLLAIALLLGVWWYSIIGYTLYGILFMIFYSKNFK